MSSNLDEEVQKLCQEIPQEKDSEKMIKLVQQLNSLLDEKESANTPSLPLHVSGPVKDDPLPRPEPPTSEAEPQQRKSA